MTPGEQLAWGALAIAGLAGSAMCSGLETGSYCLNRVRLDLRAAQAAARRAGRSDRRRGELARWTPAPHAVVLREELSQPDRLLAALLIGNNISNYVGVLAITVLLEAVGYSDWAIVALNALLLTPLLLIVGESVPKELFRLEADRLMYPLAPLLRWLRWICTASGALPLVVAVGRLAARLMGPEAELAGVRDERQRIAMLLKEGAGGGVLSEAQTTLVDRALAMGRLTVADVMVPWARVEVVDLRWPPNRLEQAIRRSQRSRLPALVDGGQVAGVIEVVEVLVRPDEAITSLVRAPARLGAEMSLFDALEAVRHADAPVGVVERSGRPIGLVTLADLAQPLLGELDSW